MYTTDRTVLQYKEFNRIKWVIDEEDKWRVSYLIYYPMDLLTMEKKAKSKQYRSVEEFQSDAQMIVHNVVIYHGGKYLRFFCSNRISNPCSKHRVLSFYFCNNLSSSL